MNSIMSSSAAARPVRSWRRACRPIPPTRSCLGGRPAGEGRSIITRAPLWGSIQVPGRPPVTTGLSHRAAAGLGGGRRGYQPLAQGAGRSSAINAMLYIRGVASDYDGWKAAVATDWGMGGRVSGLPAQ